ncbi:MAG: hypothetical protein ACREJX_04250 [Polyangiaceae bacterium]
MTSLDRERLVRVCRRRKDGPAEFLASARALVPAADESGGRIVAWGSTFFAIGWESGKLVSALEITLKLREEPGAWSSGLAVGEVLYLNEHASTFIGGVPLAAAEVLSAAAKPGETWVHESILTAFASHIKASAPMSLAWAGREVVGALLDGPPKKPTTSVSRPAMAAAPRYASPSNFDTEEADPEALAARLAQLSRDALLGGDAHSLEKWSDGLKATGEKDALAERMRAMARLAKGRVADALKALRDARKSAEEEGTRAQCQAALALGVGLAFAGRNDEALLEGLDALSRAREASDAQAEGACLAFLQKLFTGKHPSIFPPRSLVPPSQKS